MRIITGTIKSTPLPWLPTLSNIAPPKLRRQEALTRMISKCETVKKSLLYSVRQNLPEIRLRSRTPPWTLYNQNFNIKDEWRAEWQTRLPTNANLVEDPTTPLCGFDQHRNVWSKLNRFRCNHGRCNHMLHNWNARDSPICDFCNLYDQTMLHIVNDCPFKKYPGGLEKLNKLPDDAINWLRFLDIPI